MRLDTLCSCRFFGGFFCLFFSCFTRETTFVTSCLLICIPFLHFPYQRKVYPEWKEFAPLWPGSKFFPFRVDHFSEGKTIKFE